MENFRLKVFRAVARHLNFTRAADELLLTQPAVTQQIKALEDELGVPLFDRSGGRIALTAAGSALLPFADKLRTLADEAYVAVRGSVGEVGGTLALGASQTIAQYVLPMLVAGFLRECPGVAVTAISGNTDAMLNALAEHRVQLALVEGPSLRTDLHTETLMTDHMELVVPAGHEWAGAEIELDTLLQAPLLMREFGSGTRRVIEQALAAAGVARRAWQPRMELDSTEGLLSAVEAGLGVTFVSRWAVRNQLQLGTLAVARVRGLQLDRRFSLAYAAGPEPQGTAGAFRRYILQQAQQPQPSKPPRPTPQAKRGLVKRSPATRSAAASRHTTATNRREN